MLALSWTNCRASRLRTHEQVAYTTPKERATLTKRWNLFKMIIRRGFHCLRGLLVCFLMFYSWVYGLGLGYFLCGSFLPASFLPSAEELIYMFSSYTFVTVTVTLQDVLITHFCDCDTARYSHHTLSWLWHCKMFLSYTFVTVTLQDVLIIHFCDCDIARCHHHTLLWLRLFRQGYHSLNLLLMS